VDSKGDNFGLFNKTAYQQAVLNTVRSLACGGVLAMIITLWFFDAMKAMISALPASNQPGSTITWLGLLLATIVFFIVWAGLMYPI
jgi:hypothetical protein